MKTAVKPKNSSQNYKKYIHFLKKRHKGKLDCTNNQIENYIYDARVVYPQVDPQVIPAEWVLVLEAQVMWIELPAILRVLIMIQDNFTI